MKRNQRNSRRGVSLVMVAACFIPMVGFVALAIDLGMIAIARTEASIAADAGALAGARALKVGEGTSIAQTKAIAAATANSILSKQITSSQVNPVVGWYTYNGTKFVGQTAGSSTETNSLVRVTVSADLTDAMTVSKILGMAAPNVQASASAAHRPRDVAVVLDFSGSMRFGTLPSLGPSTFAEVNLRASTATSRSTNNLDTRVPTFAHHGDASAGLKIATANSAPFTAPNVSHAANTLPLLVTDFTNGGGGVAFTDAGTGDATGFVAGDKYLTTGGGVTTNQVLGLAVGNTTRNTAWENASTGGYKSKNGGTNFNGYTQGPGYYGKTFFIWPPDPAATMASNLHPSALTTNDWRQRYFIQGSSATRANDNTWLWNNAGTIGYWKAPGTTATSYKIDYAAILKFIKSVGPAVFPDSLKAGRIVYYTAIPDTIDTASFPPSNLDQRFWKDYIDYVLGVRQDTATTWTVIMGGSTSGDGANSRAGYGGDFQWGATALKISAKPTGGTPQYMHYDDNPMRPRLHFWFGPLTMMTFLGDYSLAFDVPTGTAQAARYNWWPGRSREAPMYELKLGIAAAIADIQRNHPNDWISLIAFSTPKQSANDLLAGRFNTARVPLSQQYQDIIDSLWYPPSTVDLAEKPKTGDTVTPYAADNLEVPRAMGSTCYTYGLMLAYNQFSTAGALGSGMNGGKGRKGAQKLLIFESDGAPTHLAAASFTPGANGSGYYSISGTGPYPTLTEDPTNANAAVEAKNVCQKIYDDFSIGSKKAKVHCLAFGPLMTTTNRLYLRAMQNAATPGGTGPSTGLQSSTDWKMINGTTETAVKNQIATAFTNIMQEFIQIGLIE